MTSPALSSPAKRGASANIIAWQGLEFSVPESWNPAKIEGDYAAGQLLLADLHRPRLGVRWRTPNGRKFDPSAAVRQAMQDEVGQLAADEARVISADRWAVSLLYVDTEPPGRDVWVGYSVASKRLVQIVHHSQQRNDVLRNLVNELADCDLSDAVPWSIFELSCKTPAGFSLQSQKLMAGDLSLTFTRDTSRLTLRQIAVAQLALSRMPLERWLSSQQRTQSKHYRPEGQVAQINFGSIDGVVDRSVRRRRFFWMRKLAGTITTYALHDTARDRLVLVESDDPSLVEPFVKTVGWAWSAQE